MHDRVLNNCAEANASQLQNIREAQRMTPVRRKRPRQLDGTHQTQFHAAPTCRIRRDSNFIQNMGDGSA